MESTCSSVYNYYEDTFRNWKESQAYDADPGWLAFRLATDTSDDHEEHEHWPGNSYYDLEPLAWYQIGGFHPTYIGDYLGDRFRVVHKLGHGTSSTVWLCLDEHKKRWRAVKILQASHSRETTRPEHNAESMAMELLSDIDRKELHNNYVSPPLESFWISGPNGHHACFVMPFLGPSLLEHLVYNNRRGRLAIELSFQMVKALDFLHRKGLYHGGKHYPS